MSVLHLLPTFATGGLGAASLNIIRGWPEKTRHVAVGIQFPGHVAEDMLPEFRELCGWGSVTTVDRNAFMAPPVWGQVLSQRLREIFQGVHPTHIIQYNCLDSVFAAYAVRAFGWKKKMLVHVGTTLPDNPMSRGPLSSSFNADSVFIPCHKGIWQRCLDLGISPERLHEPVWNGVDLVHYDAPPRTEAKVFGFAARMPHPEQKDWTTLFDGFKKASKRVKGLKLRIAGDGADLPRLKRLAQGAPVEFVGRVKQADMPAFYKGLDCFIMAAHAYEGFSLALCEAAASRCFLLGTDVPGVREPLSYGGGQQFLANSSTKLAELIVGLASTQSLRAENSAVSERLRERIDARATARAYFDIMKE